MSQVNKEFRGPSELTSMDRRSFIKYMGMFSSMSFLANCSRPADKIFPFATEIAEFSQQNYEFYTTLINCQGFAQGLVVKSFQGRPIKIEGNPLHPYSLGATTPEAQAALYDLYHPDRLQDLVWRGKKTLLKDVDPLLNAEVNSWGSGEGVAFLFPPDHSPIQNSLITQLQKRYPGSLWASTAPWKKTSWTEVDLKDIDLVISFDEELFYQRPDALTLAHDFMLKRKKAIDSDSPKELNTLLVLESSPTLSGAKADETSVLSREEIWNEALALKDLLGRRGSSSERMKRYFQKIEKSSSTIVFLDHDLHPDAQALEAELNSLLKAKIKTWNFSLPENSSLSDIMIKVKEGKIKTLVSWDVDPVYWYPQYQDDWKLVQTKIHLSLMKNATSLSSDITLARSHFMETWSDLKAVNGNVSIQQPLIEPIFHSLSPLTFLSALLGDKKHSYDLVKESYPSGWEEALLKGVILSQENRTEVTGAKKKYAPMERSKEFTIKLTPDYAMGFGDKFFNPLLQELPKTFSRITWQNAFYLNEGSAKTLRVKNGDVIEVKSSSHKAEGPIWIVPNVGARTLVASLGYGQEKRGTNNYVFHNGETISIKKTSKHLELALAQDDLFTDERSPIKTSSLPLKAPERKEKIKSFYPDAPLKHETQGPQWGMTIDLATCVGCQACVVACQVENNIPFVGEDQVKKGRILHWLRVDTYRVDQKTYFQPVPCMHCEKAPCEVVCPVNATVHGNGGLNEMVYNRCVGTRYCSNNCPYRVRKFNFKAYSVLKSPWSLGFNPSVSVRDRGVMEKCTYCIQRINDGLFKNEPHKVKSACQQVCPTNAIVFGDISQKESLVSLEKKSFRNYDLLEEEGLIPRTSYLKVIQHEVN